MWQAEAAGVNELRILRWGRAPGVSGEPTVVTGSSERGDGEQERGWLVWGHRKAGALEAGEGRETPRPLGHPEGAQLCQHRHMTSSSLQNGKIIGLCRLTPRGL